MPRDLTAFVLSCQEVSRLSYIARDRREACRRALPLSPERAALKREADAAQMAVEAAQGVVARCVSDA